LVPNGESKHPIEVLNETGAILFIGVHNYFPVTPGAELMPGPDQVPAQIRIIIDFPIEYQPEGLILVGHGLLSGGEINDGQAPVSQTQGAVQIIPLGIRAAMGHDLVHAGEDGSLHRLIRVRINNTANAAHESSYRN
jgi:hypothetical protein